MLRQVTEVLPSTSTRQTMPNYSIPEELLASVAGSCNWWHALVVAVFCVMMVFGSLNFFISALFFPQYIEFNCIEGEEMRNSCFTANKTLCNTFEFSEDYGRTLTEQWQLICDQQVMVRMIIVVFRCGMAVGFLIMGHFADRWGRKKIIFLCLILQSCSAVFVTATKSYITFAVCRFFNGCLVAGTPLLAVVITSELSSNKWRTFNIGLLFLSFGIGHAVLPFVWMIFRDSMRNMLLISIPQIILIVFIGTLHESPNWLLCMNRTGSAESVLIAVAHFNGQKMPSTFRLRPVQIINTRSRRSLGIIRMVTMSKVRWVMVSLYFTWSLTAFINGLLIAKVMQENVNHFKMIFLLGISSISAAIMSIILCHVMRHKLVIAFCSILGGIAATVAYIIILPMENIQNIYLLIQLVAYALCTLALFTTWNLTPRTFPTETRGEGTGAAAAIGVLSFTFAEQLSPFVFNNSTAYLLTLWCCVAVILLCCIVLLSVHNRELPDMIEDASNFNDICKPTRWTTLRATSPTVDEREIKTIDFERAVSLTSEEPTMPRRFRKGRYGSA